MTLEELKQLSKDDLERYSYLSQQLLNEGEVESIITSFFHSYTTFTPTFDASIFLDKNEIFHFPTHSYSSPPQDIIQQLYIHNDVINVLSKDGKSYLIYQKNNTDGVIITLKGSDDFGIKEINCWSNLLSKVLNLYTRSGSQKPTNRLISLENKSTQNPYPTLYFSENAELLFLNDAAQPLKTHFEDLKWVYKGMFQECLNTNESKVYEQVILDHYYSITIQPNQNQHTINVYAMDINTRKHVELKLKEEKEKAEISAQMKMEFLSTMSHEIRTPMNSIIGSINLLIDTQLDPYQAKKLEMMRFAADNLLRLINEILDLNKLEANKVSLEKIRFSIPDTMEHLFSMYADSAEKKNIGYQLKNKNTPIAFVVGDPTRISQILLNLLSNAIKFTEQGAVSLEIKSIFQNQQSIVYRFIVKDSGIGISEDKINSIFEAFTQADSSTTRKFGGTGLGLSITKKLVDLLEGELQVESQEGIGTSFIIDLPFQISEDQSVEKKKENLQIIDGNLKDKKVLLVDDNEFNILIASEFLNRWEADITIAKNGKEAVEMAIDKSKQFDIILMDLQMPVMDGYEATALIRKETGSYYQNIPIIALTADVASEQVHEIINKGFNDFASKPFDPEKLLGKLLQLIEKNSTES